MGQAYVHSSHWLVGNRYKKVVVLDGAQKSSICNIVKCVTAKSTKKINVSVEYMIYRCINGQLVLVSDGSGCQGFHKSLWRFRRDVRETSTANFRTTRFIIQTPEHYILCYSRILYQSFTSNLYRSISIRRQETSLERDGASTMNTHRYLDSSKKYCCSNIQH